MMRHHRQGHIDKPNAKTDPERPERNRRDLRSAIAHAAARLIAEGMTDYQAAKRKAARQFGATDSHTLPDNHEIELALREHLSLFAHKTQPRSLSVLRDTALRLMMRLGQFSPWLVGAVLAGTANEFSEIELELIGTEPKVFEMFLLNAGVEFKLSEAGRSRARPIHREPLNYRLEFEGAPISITLYEHHAARQATHPRDSIKHDRAEHAEAKSRFFEVGGKL